jgi:hypothetical protein
VLGLRLGSDLSDPKDAGSNFPKAMPSTISDAIDVTLKIGLRYLWVDRFCINHDDADDKHKIIQNMDAIL